MFVLKWRGGKLKTLVAKQKSFELERKGGHFFKSTGKGDNWTIVFYVGGENRAAVSECRRENGLAVQVF